LPDLTSHAVVLAAYVYCDCYRQLALIGIPRRETLRRRRVVIPALTAPSAAL
jgi:hypothetical protein